MCNDRDLAQDIVQTTFIKLLSDPKIPDVEHQKAYLFTIARNALFDELKRKKPVLMQDSEQLESVIEHNDSDSLHDQTEDAAIAEAIDKAIGNMPEKFRELMLLRYTEDLSVREIADITARNLSDIKVNLHRARLAFENRFTATMYSRVAASRKRCDTLIGMVAPYGDDDIPMPDIPKIEKHIAQCAFCNEDADSMKRRRELFALLPLLIGPALWDDITKQAQAGTLDQDFSSQHNDAKGTQGQASDTVTPVKAVTGGVNTAAKVSVVKTISIAAIIVGLVVGGVVLFNSITPEKETVPQSIDNPVASAPVAPSSSPATTSQNAAGAGGSATGSTPGSQAAQSAGTKQPVKNAATQGTGSTPTKAAPAATAQAKAQAKPQVSAKPVQTSPDQDKSSGMWLYNGPPITANIEQKIDSTSEVDASTIYLSKLGARSLSKGPTGKPLLAITNFAKGKGWIVDPALKVYVDMQLDEKGNSKIMPEMATDEHMDNIFDDKPCREFEVTRKLGTDTINGRTVEKWGCMLARTERTSIQWFDPGLKMIVAEENDSVGKMVVKDIKDWTVDEQYFELPAGYKEVSFSAYSTMAMQ